MMTSIAPSVQPMASVERGRQAENTSPSVASQKAAAGRYVWLQNTTALLTPPSVRHHIATGIAISTSSTAMAMEDTSLPVTTSRAVSSVARSISMVCFSRSPAMAAAA